MKMKKAVLVFARLCTDHAFRALAGEAHHLE